MGQCCVAVVGAGGWVCIGRARDRLRLEDC